MEMKLKVMDKNYDTKAVGSAGIRSTLVYTSAYEEGDMICLETDCDSCFCEIQLDDAMQPAIVYLTGNSLYFNIPFGEQRTSISPKAFSGNLHLLQARILEKEEASQRRNLARNPYDGFLHPGVFPHAEANVETRNEAVFAARNAVDGIYANVSHGAFPFGSWGINKQSDAEWTISFGKEVLADALYVTLRSDYPHDSHWTEATVVFSDGTSEKLTFARTDQPQFFSIEPRKITGLTLKELIKDQAEPSPFPALTQFEVWGKYICAQ